MGKIFWLASYPKSGNTWLRIFLTNYWRNALTPSNINELEQTPVAASRTLFEDLTGLEASDLTPDEVDVLRPAVYRCWAAQPTSCFAKVHDAYRFLPNGQALFPADITAGVVYLIRNPFDVALSFAAHNGQTVVHTIEQMARPGFVLSYSQHGLYEQLRQQLGSWSDHVRSWVDAKEPFPRLVVRYEDLYAEPLTEFRRIIHFLMGEFPDEAEETRVQRAIEFSSFAELQAQEVAYGFQERPASALRFFRHGQPGEWRRQLTAAQVQQIWIEHGPVMARFGYSCQISENTCLACEQSEWHYVRQRLNG